MDTKRNFPALGIQAAAHCKSPQLPSCSVTLCLLLSLLFWECFSLFFLKLSCFTPPCLRD